MPETYKGYEIEQDGKRFTVWFKDEIVLDSPCKVVAKAWIDREAKATLKAEKPKFNF